MTPVTMTPAPASVVIRYAGFWRRFLASFLDSLIVWVAIIVCYLILTIIFGEDLTKHGGRHQEEYSPGVVAALCLLWMMVLIGNWLYTALMTSSKNQGTLGKMALGLRVTDLDGRRISFGRATGRYFAKVISAFTFGIGFILAGFTQKKQALHDFIAGTLVLSQQGSVPAQVAQNAYGTP